jgi:hypothetical protein
MRNFDVHTPNVSTLKRPNTPVTLDKEQGKLDRRLLNASSTAPGSKRKIYFGVPAQPQTPENDDYETENQLSSRLRSKKG